MFEYYIALQRKGRERVRERRREGGREGECERGRKGDRERNLTPNTYTTLLNLVVCRKRLATFNSCLMAVFSSFN
jgi:hypothetical protein